MQQKQMNKKKKKRFSLLKFLLIILILLVATIGGFLAYSTYRNGWGMQGMLATMMGHDEETLKNLEEFRVLLLGVSSDISAKLTDTIIVASYNPKTQKATLLSIPRDTFIGKNSKNTSSYDKINCVYQKGPEATLEVVNEITGLNIKYYAAIETKALREVVDEIGGVEFYVPTDMDYDDRTQNLHIHLKEGLQTLDGDKAEQVLRFRKNNDLTGYSSEYGSDDTGRMRTQREFLITVAKQTIKLKNVLKLNDLLEIVHRNLDTNISLADAKDYIPYIVNFDTQNINTAVLPGENSKLNSSASPAGYLWFFKHDEKKTEELISELFEAQNGDETGEGETDATGENTTENSTSNSSTENGTTKNSTTKNSTTKNTTKNSTTKNTTKNSTSKNSTTKNTTKNSSTQNTTKSNSTKNSTTKNTTKSNTTKNATGNTSTGIKIT